MSDGLHNVAAVPFDVEIGGKTYKLNPLTIGLYAQIGEHVLSLRVDPLDHISGKIEHLDEASKSILLKHALDTSLDMASQPRASSAEVDAFINSVDGMTYIIWKLVEPHHPEVDSLEKAQGLLAELDEAAF